jgi:hypothetical protein
MFHLCDLDVYGEYVEPLDVLDVDLGDMGDAYFDPREEEIVESLSLLIDPPSPF